jgi:hypothetical protein
MNFQIAKSAKGKHQLLNETERNINGHYKT